MFALRLSMFSRMPSPNKGWARKNRGFSSEAEPEVSREAASCPSWEQLTAETFEGMYVLSGYTLYMNSATACAFTC